MLSARNRLPATIKSAKLGNVMAELVAAITRESAERLGRNAGDSAKAIVKSTEVMIAKL
jgi:molybdopterin-binding protein